MNLRIATRTSLKARLTLFTVAIFLAGVWSLAWYASQILRDEMARQLGEQQFSTASLAARQVNDDLAERIQSLENIAANLSPAMLANPKALQRYLDQRVVVRNQFNHGLFVVRPDGTAIAEVPSKGRIGVNYADRDFVRTALDEGKSSIGRPVIGKVLKKPIVALSTPVRGADGRVIGVLVGAVDLGQPNFLDSVAGSKFGTTGGYLLIAPQLRMAITGTDKSFVLKPLAPPGVNPLFDRYMQGFEGYGSTIDSRGVGIHSAAKKVPIAGWILVARMPTEEAFAPIRAMQRRILVAAIVFTLFAATLIWLMAWRTLKYQLSPLIDAANAIDAVGDSAKLPLLEIKNQDEIGQLIASFNRLLNALSQRQIEKDDALRLLQQITRQVPGIVFQLHRRTDGTYRVPYASPALRDIYRMDPESIREDACPATAVIHPDDLPGVLAAIDRSAKDLAPWQMEYRLRFEGEGDLWLLGSAVPSLEPDGSVLWHGFITSINDRKYAEQQLGIAATVFESQEGMVVTDTSGTILRVNQAFTEITGYSAEEVVGRTPRILKSGRHDAGFYEAIWTSVRNTGTWRGDIWNRRKSGEVYPEFLTITAVKGPTGVVSHYVGTMVDITERKLAEEEIQHLAFYDPLTHLPNRRLLMDRLQHALVSYNRTRRKGAVLFIDLDNFKTLNDTVGHDVGDLLLKQVAVRLSSCVREGDTVARFGGDEFVIMLEDLSENTPEAARQTETVGEKIRAELNRPYLLNQHQHHSSPSIGATLFDDPRDSTEELLKRADLAMYQAKTAGRNALRFFDPEMQAAVSARAALEIDLRQGLQDKNFQLFYQPQVNGVGRMIGVEALLRWRHPVRGMISPADFIPLAEETGLILPLGHWVLETACHQLSRWALNPGLCHLTIAVNVSARQFHHSDFVANVVAVLAQTRADPKKLKLELTESLLLDDTEAIVKKMRSLKEMGVGFSLDDFGTGYSSLSYLKQLPLDQLKIDQSFVRDVLVDPSDVAIARTIIALAQIMGIEVIAEGVELEEQRRLLADMNCHAYQGYLFGRPMPAEEIESLAEAPAGNGPRG